MRRVHRPLLASQLFVQNLSLAKEAHLNSQSDCYNWLKSPLSLDTLRNTNRLMASDTVWPNRGRYWVNAITDSQLANKVRLRRQPHGVRFNGNHVYSRRSVCALGSTYFKSYNTCKGLPQPRMVATESSLNSLWATAKIIAS